ncbi:MAG: hypothetical protein NTV34_14705 [Proteobacteria bacterium]|nr:hypothetical protein [Pseudomonadota bacterium]
MGDALKAVLAEHSFLKNYCSIARKPWGWKLTWEEGEDWPKFNFLQFTSSTLGVSQFDEIIAIEMKTWPKGKAFSVRANQDSIPLISRAGWIEEGKGILSYRIDPLEASGSFLAPPLDLELHEVGSVSAKESWIEGNVEGRDWPRAELIYAPLRKCPSSKQRLWSLKDTVGDIRATMASERFSEGENLTLLSVRPSFRRNGTMRFFFFLMSQTLQGPWFVQVNEGDAVHIFLKSLPGATLINTERRFICCKDAI